MSLSTSGISASNINLALSNDPQIRKGEIQGDILVGLQKDEEVFLFFKILNVAKFRKIIRIQIADQITTTSAVLSRELQVRTYKKEGHHQRLRILGRNIGFTHEGLVTFVGAGKCSGMDPSFTAGAAARAADLGDPVGADGKPKWAPSFGSDTIHGVLLVTGPAREKNHPAGPADAEADRLLALFGSSIRTIFRETGITRPQRGHEHFGFLDGISNPGVRGITPRTNPADTDQGAPGQDLLWPGEFVFGYPRQDAGKSFTESRPEPPLPQPWMRDGAYMVFRRLNQRVPEFRAFLNAQGKTHGMDPALLGARMVGRWQSGAPVMIAPLQDDPLLGGDPSRNNAFEYSQDTAQRRCPLASHIRKTYPRDDLEDPPTLGLPSPEGFVQTHRIMRQGIPFGGEVSDAEDAAERTADERGLMFVCYQTSIVEQFEFIQISWSNAPDFPPGKSRPDGSPIVPGHDPIIGQAAGARQMDEAVPNYPIGNVRSTLDMPDPFVVPTAAGYFFMPSITALKTM